ncbi:MAG: hypothetical protein CM15mP103_11520 [Gammaproteobacteria bacterium]|nr:MAG: hypothetical protein CM15mP103_11520 [Gammaproteobacteria bacterium]
MLIFDGLRGILTMVVNADATRDNAYEAALARLDDMRPRWRVPTRSLARSL